jgi:CBS domain-containing protein
MPVANLAVQPTVAQPTTAVPELAEIMATEEVGSVIVEKAGRPVGIVTDRDIAHTVADHDDLSLLDAEDIMTEDPITVEADAEAVELPERMADAKARRIPVVEDGKLIGVATLDDVVATTGEELHDIATVIEAQSPEYSP